MMLLADQVEAAPDPRSLTIGSTSNCFRTVPIPPASTSVAPRCVAGRQARLVSPMV